MANAVDDALTYLLQYAKRPPKEVNKFQIKLCVSNIEKVAASVGLSSETINTLATKIIFPGAYDVGIRRKLLYSLVPESGDFPYRILPYAVSTITIVPVSPAWQYAVLSWIASLLEYGVINSRNNYLHLCYTSVLNLFQYLTLCPLVSKILNYITVREDVTKSRVLFLLMLKSRAGFHNNTCQVLRLYQLFRPDLVVGHLNHKRNMPITPRNLKQSLIAARSRMEDGSESSPTGDRENIWGEFSSTEKENPYARPSAIPQPDNNVYKEKLEEKKEKIIFVSQYRKFTELIKGMDDCEKWQWPNNTATHLTNPIIIPLFRPHQQHVLVGITNWLELALRTEIVEGLGSSSKERHEKLFKAAQNLVCCTGTLIPVVNHFFTEYLTKWDESSYFEEVVSLLEAVSFTSPEFLSETMLRTVGRLLSNNSLVTWCTVVTAVAKTASSWALVAHKEYQKKKEKPHHWPQEVESCGSIVGLWFLVVRMERIFLSALLDFNYHPMIMHQILDFYLKVNLYTEELKLPAFFPPPALLTLAILVKGNISCTHRLGGFLTRIRARMEQLHTLKCIGHEEDIRQECLSMAEVSNQSIVFFASALYSSKAFGTRWRKVLHQFYPFENLKEIAGSDNLRCSVALHSSLPYIPFFAKESVDHDDLDTKKKSELRDQIIGELSDAGLTGIEECLKTYIKL